MDAAKSTQAIRSDSDESPRMSASLQAAVVEAAYILDVAGRR